MIPTMTQFAELNIQVATPMCLWYAWHNIKVMVRKRWRSTLFTVEGDLAVLQTALFWFSRKVRNVRSILSISESYGKKSTT
jgi:hypothetical protein